MSDEARIRHLLQDMTAAWNAGDASAYAGIFTEDADYITWFGARSTGRKAIEDSHRFLFDGPLKGSRLAGGTADAAGIRFLAPDVALVVSDGAGMSTCGQDAPDGDRTSVVAMTAVRDGDRWRFASFQNTRKQPVGGPED